MLLMILKVFGMASVAFVLVLLGSSAPQYAPFPVTPSNSGLTDPVTLHDFVPLGEVVLQGPEGEAKR